MNNPFLITTYISPDYFCDREVETKRILSAVNNNRNILILSLRRMGKTGLVHHVFSHLTHQDKIAVIYLDIMHCQNLGDFINELGKAVLNRFDQPGTRYYKKTMKFLSGLRPRMTFDPLSGVPAFDFQLKDFVEEQATLDQILHYLSSLEQRVVIGFDEFQQVASFPEIGTEALLRGRFQSLSNISFVFSGSRRQLLLSMFQHQKRPFYQSAELLFLDRIPAESYVAFIRSKFAHQGARIDKEALERIL